VGTLDPRKRSSESDFDSGGRSDGDRTSYRRHRGDRPDEIEITPEMIEAGADALEAVLDPDLGRGFALRIAKRVLESALRGGRIGNPAAWGRTPRRALCEP
jgi:hypothetical protein